jgi:hypothetical protein
MELTIEGAISDSYSESKIKNDLPSVTGYGGKQKTQPPYSITAPSKWKGIYLSRFLMDLLGDQDYNVSFISQDDAFTVNLTRNEINGGIRAFDETNTTLETVTISVLAYEEDDKALDSEDGPLRLVFVGENNQSILTISTLWVKQVDTIRVFTSNGNSLTITSTDITTTGSQSTQTTNSKTSIWITIWEMMITFFLLIFLRERRKKR